MVLTGSNVIAWTSTNSVFHLTIASFHKPGSSRALQKRELVFIHPFLQYASLYKQLNSLDRKQRHVVIEDVTLSPETQTVFDVLGCVLEG